MTTEERYRAILRNHLPPQAVEWIYAYLNHHKVHFHVTRERRTKYGDYRWPQPQHPFHEMSVNGDLNPYLFLWVFLHEAAHLETHLKYSSVQPHGHEWQAEYASLLAARADDFPEEVRPLVLRYAARIPLSRVLARSIEEELHRHDSGAGAGPSLRLDNLPAGSLFRLKKKPDILFASIERRRTRWLCRDAATGRLYTVSGGAEVERELS
ncbi:MAG: hypothetical protein IKJ78_01025 [Bacteroidales bacterium]|nr:hypothetical protein [Bacteroidales bacterium]